MTNPVVARAHAPSPTAPSVKIPFRDQRKAASEGGDAFPGTLPSMTEG